MKQNKTLITIAAGLLEAENYRVCLANCDSKSRRRPRRIKHMVGERDEKWGEDSQVCVAGTELCTAAGEMWGSNSSHPVQRASS